MPLLDRAPAVITRETCTVKHSSGVGLDAVAAWLGTSRRAVFRLRQSGALKTDRVGGVGRGGGKAIPYDSLRRFIAEHIVTVPEEEIRVPTEVPDLYQFEDVAERLNIPVRRLKDAARARKFEHVRIGVCRYFTPEQLAAYLQANTQGAVEPADLDADLDAARAQHQRTQRRRQRSPRRHSHAAAAPDQKESP